MKSKKQTKDKKKNDDKDHEHNGKGEHRINNDMRKEDLAKNGKSIRYDVRIKTSDCSMIENGLAIDMIIVGMENDNNIEECLQTHRIKLNSTPSDHEKDKFLKSNLDLFRLEANDVGRVSIFFTIIKISSLAECFKDLQLVNFLFYKKGKNASISGGQ